MALTQMSVRQLGHTAAGLLSARVSDHMINVLFVTVSKYISEVFIINAHTDVLTEDRVGAETRMSKGNSTDRRSSTLPLCLCTFIRVHFRLLLIAVMPPLYINLIRVQTKHTFELNENYCLLNIILKETN